jgi:SAM-dependent methyltransferase
VRATGWRNVEFVQGDVRDRGQHDQLGSGFDAVVGRWILMYLPAPADFIQRCAARLRSGGIVTFIESDLRDGAQTFPAAPLHEELARWMTPDVHLPGPQPAMGPLLFSTFLAAGLPTPELRLAAPIGGGPDWPGYAYLAESVRSLLPFMEQVGVVPPGSVEVDSLEQRLRAEVVDREGIQQLPSVIGAWSRTTS